MKPEWIAVQDCIDDVFITLKESLPGYKTKVQGEHATNLASLSTSRIEFNVQAPDVSESRSDVDTCSKLNDTHPSASKALKKAFDTLRAAFETSGRYSFCRYLDAKYPVITVKHRKTGLTVNLSSAPKVVSCSYYMRYYLAEHPELLTIYRIIKHALKIRGLHCGRADTIDSYTIFNMILAVIKQHPTQQPPYHNGTLLLQFLEFWSNADTVNNAFAADPPYVFDKANKNLVGLEKDNVRLLHDPLLRAGTAYLSAQNWKYKKQFGYNPYMLCLQDPGDPFNDLGRYCYRFNDIQATFGWLHKELLARIKAWDAMETDAMDTHLGRNKMQPLLAPLVGKKYGQLQRTRVSLITAANGLRMGRHGPIPLLSKQGSEPQTSPPTNQAELGKGKKTWLGTLTTSKIFKNLGL
jgi:non-canonical poly(A) RNA polymerase PAPD5/7